MKSRRTTSKLVPIIATWVALVSSLGSSPGAEEAPANRPAPAHITVAITHRVFVDFHDTMTVAMNERRVVGDTEYTFELVEFYPDFAIDTNNAVTSVTDDPKNPAFKVAVYEKEEKADDTWAFYGVDIPHFGRKSYLAFNVLGFEYRGEAIGRAKGKATPNREEKQP
jgi:hypothetical protein